MRPVHFLMLILATLGIARAEEKIVRLTSLEWPPYTGAALPDQGAAAAVARAAFEAVGYRLDIQFVPWVRAVDMAAKDPDVVGYFPEYHSPELETDWALSAPIGTSPLGFAERREKPVAWSSIEDLTPYRIGVVNGYINTEELDAAIADGRIQADKGVDDAAILARLAAGRIDLAVVDENVLHWLLANHPGLGRDRDALRFNATRLATKDLFVVFRDDENGRRMRDLFNEGLARIDVGAILARHF